MGKRKPRPKLTHQDRFSDFKQLLNELRFVEEVMHVDADVPQRSLGLSGHAPLLGPEDARKLFAAFKRQIGYHPALQIATMAYGAEIRSKKHQAEAAERLSKLGVPGVRRAWDPKKKEWMTWSDATDSFVLLAWAVVDGGWSVSEAVEVARDFGATPRASAVEQALAAKSYETETRVRKVYLALAGGSSAEHQEKARQGNRGPLAAAILHVGARLRSARARASDIRTDPNVTRRPADLGSECPTPEKGQGRARIRRQTSKRR